MVQVKTVRRLRKPAAILLLTCAILIAGCRKSTDASFVGTFRMGERVQVGPLVYQVLESEWRSELGSGGRTPKDRYLFLRVTITNGSGNSISVPAFTLEANGKSFNEITDHMEKVDNWFGLLRNIGGSQTEQGWVVFDAPVGAYKLVATDGGDIGAEKFAHVDIPIELE